MFNNNSSTRNFIPMANKYDRVILLVDMDCFYCQVEEKLEPSLKGKPLAVVQYNAWRGGGIIAVNYAARAKGVTRHMRGDEAKEQCPDIQLVKVPNIREKADLTKYREAGKDVAKVLQRFTPLLERASVDEAYLDITDAVNKRLKEMNDGTFTLEPKELINTYAVGFPSIGEFVTEITTSFISNPAAHNDVLYRNFHENDIPAVRQSNIRLLIGASIASEIRNAVKMETSYECSAGIAHNKILAKLACGMNKPNKQTILPLAEIPGLFETLPISKIKGLGAKFGEEICERLKVRYLGQLLKFTEAELQQKFDEKNGTWLYNICRGIDLEAVTPRFYSKSIGCCKKFPGRNNITGLKTLQHWLNELANEIHERLEKDIFENNRKAKQMVVNYVQEFDSQEISSSRSAPLLNYDTELLAKTSLEVIKTNTKQFFRAGSENVLNNPIKFLGISVGKFETISNTQNNIQDMFAQQRAKVVSNVEKQESVSVISIPSSQELKQDPKIGFQKNNIVKQSNKEKNVPSVKSFFVNVLKQDTQNTNKNLHLNDNKNNEITILSNNNIQLKSNDSSKPQENEFTVPCYSINTKRMLEQSLSEELLQNRDEVSGNSANKQIALNNILEISRQTQEKCPENNHSRAISLPIILTTFNNKEDNLKTTYVESPLKDTEDTNSSNSKDNEIKDMSIKTNEISNLTNELKTIPSEVNECSGENAKIENNSLNKDVKEIDMKSENVLHTNRSEVNRKRKFFEISSDELQEDYHHRYVEFAMPELRPEYLQFVKCPKCGIQILNAPNSIQTHQDLHFAQELSQQQRNEFRNEVRTKINSAKLLPSISNTKKSKKDQVANTAIKKSLNPSITRFLKPQEATPTDLQLISNVNQSTDSNNPDVQICDLCKTPVKLEDILEHQDFHVAKDLQRQLNQLNVNTATVVQKSASIISQKNTSNNTTSRQNKGNIRPITQFFTHSNT